MIRYVSIKEVGGFEVGESGSFYMTCVLENCLAFSSCIKCVKWLHIVAECE